MSRCRWFAVLGSCLAFGAAAAETAYPTKPIRFVVPYPAGGGVDMLARLIAPRLSERLGQQIIVDNRGGAGGNIGTELAARAPADGYTLAMAAAALAINVTLYRKLPFDPQKDFTPISLLATTPNIVAVHPSFPATSMPAFLRAVRDKPGVNYASAGNGTTSHLAAVLLGAMARIELVHVPYKGTTPAVTALLGNEVPVMLAPALTVLPHVNAGKARALAITSATRAAVLPDLPTVSESGVPGYEASQWYGVMAPAGTPAALIARLNAEIRDIIRTPEVTDRLAQQGSIPVGGTAEAFGRYLAAEIQKWAQVIRVSGARAD